MKLLEIFKKKKAAWIVFNVFEKYEFAECSNCGAEVEPDISLFPSCYPDKCPECGAVMEEPWQYL